MTIFAYAHIPRPVASTAEDILRDLTLHTSLDSLNSLKVFWDLDTNVSRILSLLPETVRSTISHHNRAVWGSYRLYYIPGKQFSITHDHRDTDFYDLSQYFPGEPEPATYQGLQVKADQLWQTITDLGMSATTTLASPVAVAMASGMLDRVRDTVPTIWGAQDNYLDAFEYALQAGAREWVSNYAVGEWSELESMDLASAYPHEASQLLDLRDCDFTKSDSLDLSRYYGFLHGNLYLDPASEYAYCSPVLTRLPDGQLTNAVGHLPLDYYSLDLIRHVYRYRMGEFKVKSAWYIHPRGGVRPRLPFKALMDSLFQQRGSPYINIINIGGESELRSYFVKRVMNGIIGKMLETKKDKDGDVRYGELYNPVYHGIILAKVACRVSEFIIENGITKSELVHVGVDGVKSTKHLPHIPAVARMGQWRCTGTQPTIILSPAGIYTRDRSPQGVSLPILRAMLDAFPSRSQYSFDGWELDLRVLQSRQNRRYAMLPKTGMQLLGKQYQSEPIEL